MAQNFDPRLRRLETDVSQMVRRRTEMRVAGKSRLEVAAELLARLFFWAESLMPRGAEILVEMAMRDDEYHIPGHEGLLNGIRSLDRKNPGIVNLVLDAVLSGAEAITEEMLFPNGRPESEETCDSRRGKRFYYRLDGMR